MLFVEARTERIALGKVMAGSAPAHRQGLDCPAAAGSDTASDIIPSSILMKYRARARHVA